MDSKITSVLEEALTIDLYDIIISNPIKREGIIKIKVRPILLQNKLLFQVEEFDGKQVFHSNDTREIILEKAQDWFSEHFRQAEIRTKEQQYMILISKKGKVTIKKKQQKVLGVKQNLTHNRTKQYLLQEGTVVPFLVDLGVMTAEGKIIHAKYDKFKQINRYVEFIEDVIPSLEAVLKQKEELTIIDFGCGKSYLTFALYYYLHEVKGYPIHVIGLDLKHDVIEHCNKLAKRYGYDKLEFLHGDIATYEGTSIVDMVVTLHACDTATDYALHKAVTWGAKVILSVPCCQHEVNKQIACPDLEPVLKYGLIKERTAALVTDSLRASLLEILGYRTQILEFIDMEHTPKNILIRAVKEGTVKNRAQLLEEYMRCKEYLHVEPTFYTLCKKDHLIK
ncbi:class I SAM-dependent methyltransferase [Anaerosporobacter faecicola]|uniref:class I SAM-dependent methyltransferase n=1 Tax=Anaerosporobacter faecicola TaxID=2718714 RepID=UPI00143CA412|nr:SAM-dependent methyltransferase [Anaerosporobacter faecicola]